MISKIDSSSVFNDYQTKNKEIDRSKAKGNSTDKASTLSKTDALKQSVASGNYKIDIKALAAKVADSLM